MPENIYIAGEKTNGDAGTLPVLSPYDHHLLAQVSQASPQQLESAIIAAVQSREPLAKLPAYQRAVACAHLSRRIAERSEDFAKCIAHEAGKPLKSARGEVQRAISTFHLASEEATRILGEQLPVDIDPRGENYWAIVERFPIGPCSFITPFNFPLNLVAHKVAPAIAAGCPFIVKPSERTPLTALLLGDLLAETNLPKGSWSILPCHRSTAQPLVSDDRLKLLSFTGSPQVGFKMKADAGKKTVILELGNNSAVIVEPDANLEDAAARIVNAAFGYAGQSCISVQRILLHESIAGKMTHSLVERTQKLIVGDPLDENTDVGPVIDPASAERLRKWIRESGGKILCGENGSESPSTLLTPTLIQNPNPKSPLITEEAFGPVATIETYADFNDALARINASRFGLQAGLFSRDIHKIRHAFEQLEIGGLIVNDVPTTRIDNMPYGGIKDSGLGREGLKYAIHHLTEPRTLLIRKG